MSEQIVFTNRWQIMELSNARIEDLRIGRIEENPMGPVSILSGDKVSKEQLRAILSLGEVMGDFDQTRWLYESIQIQIDNLLRSFNLDEDGMMDITPDHTRNYFTLVQADANFHSIIVAAKRFIDRSEKLLKKRYGKDSRQYREWRSTVRTAYDSSMTYALLYDLRNCLEHGFWTISLVNVDMSHLKAGLAINIDNDLLNSSLKSSTKNRLRKWASETVRKGDPAWLSLGKCLETYRNMILALYTLLLFWLHDEASLYITQHRQILQGIPGTLILWTGTDTLDHSASGQYRAYSIAGEEGLLQINNELNRLGCLLDHLNEQFES